MYSVSIFLSIVTHNKCLHVTMRLFHALASCQLLATGLVAAVPLDSQPASTINIDPTVEPLEALAQLQQHAYETLRQRESVSKRDSTGCSLATATIRKGWQVLHIQLFSFINFKKGIYKQEGPESIHRSCTVSSTIAT